MKERECKAGTLLQAYRCWPSQLCAVQFFFLAGVWGGRGDQFHTEIEDCQLKWQQANYFKDVVLLLFQWAVNEEGGGASAISWDQGAVKLWNLLVLMPLQMDRIHVTEEKDLETKQTWSSAISLCIFCLLIFTVPQIYFSVNGQHHYHNQSKVLLSFSPFLLLWSVFFSTMFGPLPLCDLPWYSPSCIEWILPPHSSSFSWSRLASLSHHAKSRIIHTHTHTHVCHHS